MRYNVLQIELQDPDEDVLPEERDMALFLELLPGGSGKIFRVIGSVDLGFELTISEESQLADLDGYVPEQTLLVGCIHKEKAAKFEDICRAVEVPGQQMRGFRRMNPGEELKNSRTWVAEVVKKIKEEGLVQ